MPWGGMLMIGEAERFRIRCGDNGLSGCRGERSRTAVIGRRIISRVSRNNSELPLLE